MKTKFVLASALLMFQVGAVAGNLKQKAIPSRDQKKESRLGTNFRFDGSNLNGKFQNPLSTTAEVENDKVLEDLLGARKNFDDRELNDLSRRNLRDESRN